MKLRSDNEVMEELEASRRDMSGDRDDLRVKREELEDLEVSREDLKVSREELEVKKEGLASNMASDMEDIPSDREDLPDTEIEVKREAELGDSTDNDSTDEGHSRKRRRTTSETERRRRNTEASARFRIKRRQKEQEMSERFSTLNNHISDLRIQVKTLEMENDCLKRMLLGGDGRKDDAVPRGSEEISKTIGGLSIGSLTNYQLLALIKEKSNERFKITSI
ncbi:DEKNAAC104409 [Brettanomyces naardenensis]|uniref:DEKNAAC104409 n=1 Tax=Brettanomyces naardenensis TaxID=13370 RepID=A0A448YQW0_BRENA|nr:DEKNAAC104409 [Brettanomyces naardenensis]